MNKARNFWSALLLLAFCVLTVVSAMAQAPAFPGAEGHGRYVTGGRGGKVVHVTNLNDSGVGSFRAAVTTQGKKIVVFDVGGVIALKSDVKMTENTTVLGQTAPYPGITLRYFTVVPGSNSIIRFLRFRRGQEKDVNDGADAFWTREKTDIIIDHCSVSWSIDELASFYDNNNFTMQWCMLGEALANAGHEKGKHSFGGIWGGKLASFHHNYIGHVDNRAPRFNGARYEWSGYTDNRLYATYNWANTVLAEVVDFRNCVLYNWGTGNGCYGGPGGGQINIVGNYYKAGPATKNKKRVTEISVGNADNSTNANLQGMTSRYHIVGNYVIAVGDDAPNYDWTGVTFDEGTKIINGEAYTPDNNNYYQGVAHVADGDKQYVPIKMQQQAYSGWVTTHAAEKAYAKVLAFAGASQYRDDVDVRYVNETKQGTATYRGSVTGLEGIVDRVSDVKGYTEANFPTGNRAAGFDSDDDGMPDVWETANGLNPKDATDATTVTLDTKGYYTNIEVYANSLVEDLMKQENADANVAVDEYYPVSKRVEGLDYYSGREVPLLGTTGGDTPASVEKALYATNFSDWTDAPASTSASVVNVSTLYSHENLSFTIVNTQISATNKNTAKFPNWTGGYLMAAKAADPGVVTSPLKSISRVHFKHGATGSNRGWRLEAMGDGDADWVVLSDAVANPSSGADVDVEVNKTNCRLRFTNLTTNQNAYLFELVIYGKVDLGDKPLLGSFKVNGTDYKATDVFEEQADGSNLATIEVSRGVSMISDNNPLTDVVAESGTIASVTYEPSANNKSGKAVIVVALNGETVKYIVNFVLKPMFTLTYYNIDGTVLGTQQVEKDAAIGRFNNYLDRIDVASNRVFRGWFVSAGGTDNRKYSVTDVVTGDSKLYAVVTDKEIASTTNRYTFSLTAPFFYDEDHEAFHSIGSAKFHDNQHGWVFGAGDAVELLVGGNAYILLSGCSYSSGNIVISNEQGNQLAVFAAKAETDGKAIAYKYEGGAGVLRLSFDATTYLHGITIANMQDNPVTKDASGYYLVKAGDAVSLLNTLMVANTNDSQRTKIFIPAGTYDLGETVLTPISGDNISLIGADAERTIIVNAPLLKNEGIGTTATFLITGKNTYLQDLTLRNDLDYYNMNGAGRAVVIQDKGNRTICKNVNLVSHQDTYYSNANGQFYFEDGAIHGTVDYVCGSGDVFFNRVNFINEPLSKTSVGADVIAAPYPADNCKFGYVMNNCKITNLNEGGYSLGRSWGGKSKLAWINTTMTTDAFNDGKSIMRFTAAGMNVPAYRFKEYGSKDEQGRPLTPQSNVVTFTHSTGSYTYNTTLGADSLSFFALSNVFTDWQPSVLAQQRVMSEVKLADNTLSWTPIEASDNVVYYAVFKNDELLGITSDTRFAVEAGTVPAAYTVRAANDMGGFGTGVQPTMTTGIQRAETDETDVVDTQYFTLDGRRCYHPGKGVFIMMKTMANGTKNSQKVILK